MAPLPRGWFDGAGNGGVDFCSSERRAVTPLQLLEALRQLDEALVRAAIDDVSYRITNPVQEVREQLLADVKHRVQKPSRRKKPKK